MIQISIIDNNLILKYSTDNPWVLDKLRNEEDISLRKGSFTFLKSDLREQSQIDDNDDDGVELEFILGILADDQYFKIEGRKLGITQDTYIQKDAEVSERFFVGVRDTSIFQKISRIVTEDIFIGGTKPEAVPIEEFQQLLKDFPNAYEITKYVDARLASVLSNYFDSTSNIEEKYQRYMNKRQSVKGEDLPEIFKEGEVVKYETILEKLELMLANQNKYNEKQWQKEILEIILLLYPKYIYAFEEAPIRDHYQNKDRKIDFLLIDANGNTDIIEIKRPLNEKIITKGRYRDNYIPLRELSGTVMQIEKYIFHLNKSGQTGENRLTTKYKSKLPADFKIKITNPGGMIIMGRDNLLSSDQMEDFEVVKRKYKNVIDIITYDDLIRRLKSIITAWKNRA